MTKDTEFIKGSLSTKLARSEAELRSAKESKQRNENRIAIVGFTAILITTILNFFVYWLLYYNFNSILLGLNVAAVIVTAIAFILNSAKADKRIRATMKKRNYYVTEYKKVA